MIYAFIYIKFQKNNILIKKQANHIYEKNQINYEKINHIYLWIFGIFSGLT